MKFKIKGQLHIKIKCKIELINKNTNTMRKKLIQIYGILISIFGWDNNNLTISTSPFLIAQCIGPL